MKRAYQLIATPSQLGGILRARRKARKLSQHDLAAKLNVSQSRLSTLESDPAGITLDRLLAIAALLGLEIVVQEKATESEQRKPAW